MKDLGIKLTKEAKDLYDTNYGILKNKLKTLEDKDLSH